MGSLDVTVNVPTAWHAKFPLASVALVHAVGPDTVAPLNTSTKVTVPVGYFALFVVSTKAVMVAGAPYDIVCWFGVTITFGIAYITLMLVAAALDVA